MSCLRPRDLLTSWPDGQLQADLPVDDLTAAQVLPLAAAVCVSKRRIDSEKPNLTTPARRTGMAHGRRSGSS